MGAAVLSDAQIAALTDDERRDLICRLQRPLRELVEPAAMRRRRRLRLVLLVVAAVVLVPWIAYLSVSLPEKYVAHNWPATWIGLDIVMLVFMVATALLGLLRRQLVMLTAFTTGVLLICDAWFDVMTAGPVDLRLSILTAVLAEIPLAIFLIVSALRILWLTAGRLYLLEPGMPLWRIPLLT